MKFIKRKKQRRNTQKIKNQVESKVSFYAFSTLENLYKNLSSSYNGLTSEVVENKQDEFGENVITIGNKNTVWHRLKESVINPFNVILLVVAGVTYFTDVVVSKKADYLTVSIILSLVVISSLVAFIQNQRSNNAALQLSKMISNKSSVLRDGKLVEISMEQIVPGDIVKLSAGDMIPADVRFLSTKDTFVAQAALTGESNPVEKFSSVAIYDSGSLTDFNNIAFMGSNVISGSATAIVLSTGNNTYLGSMAKSLSGERSKTSFENGVSSVSKLLIKMMVIMVPIVFILNGFLKNDWLGSLFFAVTIAVGLTPEMLPVIMTSTLAKGAITMSKHKVIVRNLGAIQTFGEMDILCTDKTGTLTEDKIVLEKYMNVNGLYDTRILRHAYLNSYFQTGLKNLIDIAIINRAKKHNLDSILDTYECVDEIPFDFSRRRMSVVLSNKNGKKQLITKGAVEEIISISSFVEIDGKVLPMDDETKRMAMATYNKHNSDGLRMIAVAQKNEVPESGAFGVIDECNMVLIGFLGFLDPPKESAKSAISALKEHGVRTVVLTGDSEGVALKVCSKVGINTDVVITGFDVEKMDDESLISAVKTCDLFAKLSPSQKERVVSAFQIAGHTVGYLGDGINDAQALRQADVGISVDSAVDIAKETADIILLEKNLMVLENGVIEGRHTFGNIIKYIKMATSGNFGNIISIIIASIFIPFLPMLPVQLLVQNLLCDFSQLGIPFDSVDKEYLKKPRKWETKSIKSFMLYMGPISSIFDILCFIVLWWGIKANSTEMASLFQSGWFVFGTVSQILVIHIIRTSKISFSQSKPSLPLVISSLIVVLLALTISFTSLAIGIDMMTLPIKFIPWLIIIMLGYFLFAQVIKKIYIKHYNEWL